MQALVFRRARRDPARVAAFLTRRLRRALGEAYDARHFLPPYPPWEQRLCLVPDGDLFAALREGSASVTTGSIAQVEEGRIVLDDGTALPADIIVTATGLKLALGGNIAVSLDGEAVHWPQRWFYRNCLFSNLPNLAVVFGYLNASWTLRADLTAQYVCRVLREMEARGAAVAMPVRGADEPGKAADPAFGFSSGYLARAADLMPRSEERLPWRLNMDYLQDLRDYRDRPVADGVLAFQNTGPSTGQSPVARATDMA